MSDCMTFPDTLDGTESSIEILSELRATFNCFNELEEPCYRALSDAIQALSAPPEIIRCKDCKYWHREIHNGIEYFNFSLCDLNHYGDGHNFYCADAERRTDGM